MLDNTLSQENLEIEMDLEGHQMNSTIVVKKL